MSSMNDDWGVFNDAEDNWGDDEVDPTNPVISAEEDNRMHSAIAKPSRAVGPANQGPVALVAVFDENNEPMVARTVMRDGRPVQLEKYRRPTPDEYNSIMFGGKIVRGGVVASEVPAGTNVDARLRTSPLGASGAGINWRRLALYVGVGGAAVGGGWFAYKKLQERKGKGGKKR